MLTEVKQCAVCKRVALPQQIRNNMCPSCFADIERAVKDAGKTKPEPFDPATLTFEQFDLGAGVQMISARNRNYQPPVGFLWFVPAFPAYADITDCYTPHWARRRGVMRALYNRVASEYPTLITATATEDGEKFLTAFGFEKSDVFGWTFNRKA